jgi:hypothetical protein
VTLLTEIWPVLAAIIAALGWGFFQRQAGANAERLKQAGRDREAVEERLEMHRDATEIEREVSGMSDDKLDAEVRKRSRK